MFCAQFSFDLVTLTFGLLTLAVSDELSFIHPTHVPIFSILRLFVPELCDYLITVPSHGMVTVHALCHVTCHGGGGAKMIHIFEILDSNLPVHFVTFWELWHPHVKAISGCKKTKSSQNRSPKWRFFGNLRV